MVVSFDQRDQSQVVLPYFVRCLRRLVAVA